MAEKKKRTRRSFGGIRKLPSGRFQAWYVHPETKKRTPAPDTFQTRTDADAWLSVIRADITTGRVYPERVKRPTVTSARISSSTPRTISTEDCAVAAS